MLPLHFTAAFLLVSCVDILTTGLGATKKAEIVLKRLKIWKRPGTVRLRGGSSPEEGNIEIIHKGVWGSVCDDEWDSNDGNVVCRQLGYSALLRVTHNSQFGNLVGRYWMDNVYCDGSESGLAKCRFDGWGRNDCEPDEAAGVICANKTEEFIENTVQNNLALLDDTSHSESLIKIFSLSNFQIRLTGGRDSYEGRVEVRWGSNGEKDYKCASTYL